MPAARSPTSLAASATASTTLPRTPPGLLDALDVERAHIVGMSVGGGIGQLLALDHPERVASLTLASTTPGGPAPNPDLPGPTPELRPSSERASRARLVRPRGRGRLPGRGRATVCGPLAALRRGRHARLAGRVHDRSANLEWGLANAFLQDSRDPGGSGLVNRGADARDPRHGGPGLPVQPRRRAGRRDPGAELLPMEATTPVLPAPHLGRRRSGHPSSHRLIRGGPPQRARLGGVDPDLPAPRTGLAGAEERYGRRPANSVWRR